MVTFGANNLDRMVITFQTPDEDYPLFYVKASNRGVINVYSCEINKDVSISVDCTGIRTPLGEAVELEIYTTNGDTLLGRGEFIVSAILLSTPANLTEIPAFDPSPTEESTSTP